MATGEGKKTIIAAMAANAGIAVAKFVAFVVTGSASMLAESIHSAADTSNEGLLLLGSRRARKIADDQHQFGYGRERYFWAFIVALVLFTVGGLYSVLEGIGKIREPHEISSVGWAIGVLVAALAFEGFSFGTAVGEARAVMGDQSWWSYVRRSRAPEVPVVLFEDAAALTGLTFALAEIGMSTVTGDPVWDGVGTLAIGVLLVTVAVILTVEMQSLLIGEAATDDDIRMIREAVSSRPSVVRIIDLRTQHIGPEELLVAGKLEFDRGLSNVELTEAIDRVEGAIRDRVPHARHIYLEPDVFEDGYEPSSLS